MLGFVGSRCKEVNSTNVNTPPLTLHSDAEKRCGKRCATWGKNVLRCTNFMTDNPNTKPYCPSTCKLALVGTWTIWLIVCVLSHKICRDERIFLSHHVGSS